MSYPTDNPREPGEGQARTPRTQRSARLNAEDIREFQALMQKERGVTLNDSEAWSRATEVVALFRMLLAPLPEDDSRESKAGIGGPQLLPDP